MSEKVKLAEKEISKCLALMRERDKKYGDSWKEARLTSLIDYVMMKFARVTKLSNNPKSNYDKIESDLQDAINYALFSLIKLREEVPK